MKASEGSTRRFDYGKWKLPLIVLVIATTAFVALFVVIPYAFSDRFVACSCELAFITGPGHPKTEVVYLDGSLVRVMFVYPQYMVTNNYFTPLHLCYNGFENVMLVYDRAVDDPADIVANADWLVGGGFHSGQYDWAYQSLESATSYDYYITRRTLCNYTKTLRVQGTKGDSFYSASFGAVWRGQDLSGNPVSPGTYYIYYIEYGIVSKPVNLTITAILWTK